MTNFTPDDTPISQKEQDALQVKPRIVNRMLNLLGNKQISALTLAVTGEWGVGKSSAMNLLANELNNSKESVVIHFEPLLEGKFEVIEILELFYLKLYSALSTKGPKVDSIFKKLLSSLGALAFSGTELSVGISNLGSASLDLGEKYEKLLEIWRTNDIKSFSEQTAKLNAFLQEEQLRVFIFIDEIDRLPSDHIINFLLFARILETFERLICIVGIDYEQVVLSLKSSKKYGTGTYDQARAYLDKLFHARFHIHHNESILISFAAKKLKSIDENAFNSVLESGDYEIQNAFALVIEYLRTPRQIKKWLTSLTINMSLINYYTKDLIESLKLSAVCVKHPIVLNNLARHTLPMLSMPGGFLAQYFKSRYGSDFLYNDKDKNQDKAAEVILQSTGVKKSADENIHFELSIQYITDPTAYKMLKEVLNPAKLSWLSLLIDGYIDENKVKIYYEYLEGDINSAITWMIEHPEEATVIASDLRDTILKQQILPVNIADLGLLNQLWQKTITPGDIGNPYKALFFPMYKHSAEDMLENASLSLLEAYLHDLLGVFGIKNSAPQKYDLSQFSQDEFKHGSWRSQKRAISDITYNQIPISDFTQSTIKELLKAWISRVEGDFTNDFDSVIQN